MRSTAGRSELPWRPRERLSSSVVPNRVCPVSQPAGHTLQTVHQHETYLGIFAVGTDKLSLKVGASLSFSKRACAPDRREAFA
jgi:hypothetical protein